MAWEGEAEGRGYARCECGWIPEGIRQLNSLSVQYLNKPAWDPLLPPPLPEPHFRPYTLVLDLDDLLVHSSWDVRRLAAHIIQRRH